MDSFFSMDNAFFRFMGRLTDLVWLNILTLICCIPVFTAGAAICAMYTVNVRLAMGEGGTITKGFFVAFKENFKNATVVWLPSIIFLTILCGNAYLLHQGILADNRSMFIAVGISIAIIATFLVMILNYTYALMGRYENSLKQTVKNAGLLMLAFFPRSICIVIIWLFPLALMLISNGFLFAWGLYGIAIPGYVNAMVFASIFKKTEEAGK